VRCTRAPTWDCFRSRRSFRRLMERCIVGAAAPPSCRAAPRGPAAPFPRSASLRVKMTTQQPRFHGEAGAASAALLGGSKLSQAL
jgi:hypothetical protein